MSRPPTRTQLTSLNYTLLTRQWFCVLCGWKSLDTEFTEILRGLCV